MSVYRLPMRPSVVRGLGNGAYRARPRAQRAAQALAHKRYLNQSLGAEWFLSRRDSMIVARHEVLGKASLKTTVP